MGRAAARCAAHFGRLNNAAGAAACLLNLAAALILTMQVYFGGWPEVSEEGPQRYGPNAAGWVRVSEGWTLRDALAREDHIIPGIPAFFVLAKGSDFRQRFLDGDIPLL